MSKDNDDLVEIKKYVRPDFTHTAKVKKWDDKYEYFRESFMFELFLVAVERCNEEGVVKRNYDRDITYKACMRVGDEIMVIQHNCGWVTHEEATEYLAEQIAEKALLS